MLTWKSADSILKLEIWETLLRDNGWTWMSKETIICEYIYIYMFLIIGNKEDHKFFNFFDKVVSLI